MLRDPHFSAPDTPIPGRGFFRLFSILVLTVGLLLLSITVFGQRKDSASNRVISVLPVVYFTPETNWAFGGTSIALFLPPEGDSIVRSSSVQALAVYTLNRQILLWLPFQLFLKENKYWVYGQLGYYRYPYLYNGIGNEAPEDFEEDYSARFPRLRIHALRRFGSKIYAGPIYWFQHTVVFETEEGGVLAGRTVPGSDESLISAAGPMVIYDTRDNQFFPEKGSLIRMSALFNNGAFGSDFSYEQYLLDARKYLAIKKKHILAGQFYTVMTQGTAPFNQMALLGGPERMRGYRQGIYRDKHLMMAQLEYRSPYWKDRVGGALFAGYGGVADGIDKYRVEDLRPSFGGGLRLRVLPQERINLRLDLGFGESGNQGVYVTFSEAF